jgi:hypothetical protein
MQVLYCSIRRSCTHYHSRFHTHSNVILVGDNVGLVGLAGAMEESFKLLLRELEPLFKDEAVLIAAFQVKCSSAGARALQAAGVVKSCHICYPNRCRWRNLLRTAVMQQGHSC